MAAAVLAIRPASDVAGAVGGAIFQVVVGTIVDRTHGGHLVPSVYAASASPLGLGLLHALAPRLERAAVATAA